MFQKAVGELGSVYNLFCTRTPIHGIQYMVRTDISTSERWIWRLIVITFVSLMIYLCFQMSFSFYENPTVTNLADTHYSVGDVDLPAVAICSNNKMSKKRTEKFIDELNARFNTSKKWLRDQITWLGKMHDFNIFGLDERMELQNILDVYMQENVAEWGDMRQIIRKLAVSCEELLEECYWMGLKYDCSKLFLRRLTGDGFCCTFNYIKETQNSSKRVLEEKGKFLQSYDMSEFNFQNALKILVNGMPGDYFYSDFLFQGVDVKIFNKHVYPDSATSGVQDIFVGTGYEAYLTLDANHIRASAEVSKYPLEARKCIMDFDDEPMWLSECLLDCKIKTVKALCHCIPFMYPFDGGYPVCNLLDLYCLNKYKDKLSTINPYNIETNELDKEKEDSLQCRCYPACTKTLYKVYASYAELERKGEPLKTHSFINIFYGKKYINLYEIDIQMYWFDLLSNIGGLCSIVMGVSVVNLIEFGYFFVIFLYNMAFTKNFRPE